MARSRAECASGELIGAWRATEPEIDAVRVERSQRTELLRDHERRMVRKHDAAGAHPNGSGAASHVTDDHGRGRARDARHVVMLGEPEAAVAQLVRALSQAERIAKGLGGRGALGHRRKIENGKRNHRCVTCGEAEASTVPRRRLAGCSANTRNDASLP